AAKKSVCSTYHCLLDPSLFCAPSLLLKPSCLFCLLSHFQKLRLNRCLRLESFSLLSFSSNALSLHFSVIGTLGFGMLLSNEARGNLDINLARDNSLTNLARDNFDFYHAFDDLGVNLAHDTSDVNLARDEEGCL